MHTTLLKYKCDAMHDFLKPFKQQLSQKFHKNFINFEKSQNFQKSQKLGQKE